MILVVGQLRPFAGRKILLDKNLHGIAEFRGTFCATETMLVGCAVMVRMFQQPSVWPLSMCVLVTCAYFGGPDCKVSSQADLLRAGNAVKESCI